MDKDICSKYCGMIRKRLVAGSSQEKEEFVQGFSHDVREFVEAHPACTLEELYTNFGKPEEVAQGYLAAFEESIVRSSVKQKRIFYIILCSAVVVVLIAVLTYLGWRHYMEEKYQGDYIVEHVYQGDPRYDGEWYLDPNDPDVLTY